MTFNLLSTNRPSAGNIGSVCCSVLQRLCGKTLSRYFLTCPRRCICVYIHHVDTSAQLCPFQTNCRSLTSVVQNVSPIDAAFPVQIMHSCLLPEICSPTSGTQTHTDPQRHTQVSKQADQEGKGSRATRKNLGWKKAFFHMTLLSDLNHGRAVMALCVLGVQLVKSYLHKRTGLQQRSPRRQTDFLDWYSRSIILLV